MAEDGFRHRLSRAEPTLITAGLVLWAAVLAIVTVAEIAGIDAITRLVYGQPH